MARVDQPRIPATVGLPLLIGVILTGTLSVLDSTLVVPLLSTIGSDLGGGTAVSWLVAAYLIASTVTIPVWGRWLDLRGERAALWAALIVFILGTTLAIFSVSLPMLIAARVVQGIGAGGLVPVGQALLARRCTTDERARLQVYYNVAYGAAAGLGPLIGGALVAVSWRWAFVIIIPFAILSAALLAGRLESTPRSAVTTPFDRWGSVLMTIGLVALLIGIERSSAYAFLIGAVLVAVFVWHSRRGTEALIPWRVLGHRVALAASAVGMVIGLTQFAMLTYLPLLSQRLDPGLNAGIVVIPLTVLWMTLGSVTGILALKIGTRTVVVIGVLLGTASTMVVAWTATLPSLLAASVLIGAAAGFVLIPALLAIQHVMAKADVGAATSMLVLTRNFGGAAGATLTGVLLAGVGVRETFLILTVITIAALVPALALPGRAPA